MQTGRARAGRLANAGLILYFFVVAFGFASISIVRKAPRPSYMMMEVFCECAPLENGFICRWCPDLAASLRYFRAKELPCGKRYPVGVPIGTITSDCGRRHLAPAQALHQQNVFEHIAVPGECAGHLCSPSVLRSYAAVENVTIFIIMDFETAQTKLWKKYVQCLDARNCIVCFPATLPSLREFQIYSLKRGTFFHKCHVAPGASRTVLEDVFANAKTFLPLPHELEVDEDEGKESPETESPLEDGNGYEISEHELETQTSNPSQSPAATEVAVGNSDSSDSAEDLSGDSSTDSDEVSNNELLSKAESEISELDVPSEKELPSNSESVVVDMDAVTDETFLKDDTVQFMPEGAETLQAAVAQMTTNLAYARQPGNKLRVEGVPGVQIQEKTFDVDSIVAILAVQALPSVVLPAHFIRKSLGEANVKFLQSARCRNVDGSSLIRNWDIYRLGKVSLQCGADADIFVCSADPEVVGTDVLKRILEQDPSRERLFPDDLRRIAMELSRLPQSDDIIRILVHRAGIKDYTRSATLYQFWEVTRQIEQQFRQGRSPYLVMDVCLQLRAPHGFAPFISADEEQMLKLAGAKYFPFAIRDLVQYNGSFGSYPCNPYLREFCGFINFYNRLTANLASKSHGGRHMIALASSAYLLPQHPSMYDGEKYRRGLSKTKSIVNKIQKSVASLLGGIDESFSQEIRFELSSLSFSYLDTSIWLCESFAYAQTFDNTSLRLTVLNSTDLCRYLSLLTNSWTEPLMPVCNSLLQNQWVKLKELVFAIRSVEIVLDALNAPQNGCRRLNILEIPGVAAARNRMKVLSRPSLIAISAMDTDGKKMTFDPTNIMMELRSKLRLEGDALRYTEFFAAAGTWIRKENINTLRKAGYAVLKLVVEEWESVFAGEDVHLNRKTLTKRGLTVHARRINCKLVERDPACDFASCLDCLMNLRPVAGWKIPFKFKKLASVFGTKELAEEVAYILREIDSISNICLLLEPVTSNARKIYIQSCVAAKQARMRPAQVRICDRAHILEVEKQQGALLSGAEWSKTAIALLQLAAQRHVAEHGTFPSPAELQCRSDSGCVNPWTYVVYRSLQSVKAKMKRLPTLGELRTNPIDLNVVAHCNDVLQMMCGWYQQDHIPPKKEVLDLFADVHVGKVPVAAVQFRSEETPYFRPLPSPQGSSLMTLGTGTTSNWYSRRDAVKAQAARNEYVPYHTWQQYMGKSDWPFATAQWKNDRDAIKIRASMAFVEREEWTQFWPNAVYPFATRSRGQRMVAVAEAIVDDSASDVILLSDEPKADVGLEQRGSLTSPTTSLLPPVTLQPTVKLLASSAFQPYGLRNLDGTSCYINATWQSLASIRCIRSVKAQTTFNEMQEKDPTTLCRCISEAHGLLGEGQQDAHQYLLHVLETYEIVQQFTSLHAKTVTCTHCGAASQGTFSEVGLSVSLTPSSVCSLVEIIHNDYLSAEGVEDWKCLSCGRLGAEIVKHIVEPPACLMVHIKRFSSDGGEPAKNTTPVDYGDQVLQVGSKNYALRALLLHDGTLNTGHYQAMVQYDGQWYMANDSIVTPCRFSSSIASAYMLFYEAVTTLPPRAGAIASSMSRYGTSVYQKFQEKRTRKAADGKAYRQMRLQKRPKQDADAVMQHHRSADESEYEHFGAAPTNESIDVLQQRAPDPGGQQSAEETSKPVGITAGSMQTSSFSQQADITQNEHDFVEKIGEQQNETTLVECKKKISNNCTGYARDPQNRLFECSNCKKEANHRKKKRHW